MGNKSSSRLSSLNSEDIPFFSLNGYRTRAKIVDVYDGDTCTIIFKWEKKYRKFKCRCSGYDSPEMKPRLNIENREQVIENAKLAKNRLIELTKGYVFINCLNFDKYGRLLVDIYDKNNVYINLKMVEEGHGYYYNGGKKQ